ncbi:type II toxin-antitoxin system VapC family toxin [Endothiovibrio diazotrophicus]
MTPAEIPSGETVALDTVTFIYFLEHHERHFAAAEALFRRIEAGDLLATASTLVLTELLVPAYRAEQLNKARAVTRLLTHFPNLQLHAPSVAISAEAARIRAQHNLRTPDAIHTASAIHSGARYLVTNDRKIGRVEKLAVVIFEAT